MLPTHGTLRSSIYCICTASNCCSFLQVVDSRDPLFYYSYDLARYVQEVSPLKASVMLLNKADFLTEQQREIWAEYFRGSDTASVFFSAVVDEEVDGEKEIDLNSSKILSTSETLAVFRTLVPKETAPTLTVGFLGYPNVGKSSTINRFLNCKRLQVSSIKWKNFSFKKELFLIC